MNSDRAPTLDEVALGGFFEDIGKFMQRAYGSVQAMEPAPRARESEILPPDRHGKYTHKHALWTEAFFDWMEKKGLGFPAGINLSNVRDAAVYHHNPRTPSHWLSAVADRLSAGMDRAAYDESADATEISRSWDAFRRKPLACIFDQVDIGRGTVASTQAYPLVSLSPKAMFPHKITGDDLPEHYDSLWRAFTLEFECLCEPKMNTDLFQQSLISLSERYTWAIPSSTIDHPDVSLHDHNRTVAAFAACLYRHHDQCGDLQDESAIKDLERPKFRILVGDLSGIQTSLFRLKSEGVKGINRILRARSFLIGQIGEMAALLCRQRLALPPWCLLQGAGGRFQLLLPEFSGIEEAITVLRHQLDAWMLHRYTGDLVLNLAITPPLAGKDFHGKRFPETLRTIAESMDEAKQRPLSTRLMTAEAARIEASYPPDGTCSVCGIRPAVISPQGIDNSQPLHCLTCDDEENRGSKVPKALVVAVNERNQPSSILGCFDLAIRNEALSVDDERALLSGFEVWSVSIEGNFPLPKRFLANHVPHLTEEESTDPRYDHLSEDAKEVKPGQLKQFEHLAANALEWDGEKLVGRAMLAVLKADVDDLGFVFGCGLKRERTTVGRVAQMSRMMDGFFTGYLTHLLETEREFRDTYTVYAGGDDLLLIAPWFSAIKLARRLRADFGLFVNHNPNLTLSAGIEFCGVNEPLNRAVIRAEAKLERAKSHPDKDRVTLVVDDHSIPWNGGIGSLDWALEEAEWLNDCIRREMLPATFLYRMLTLDRQRSGDPGWRAKWGYHLARFTERLKDSAARRDIGMHLDRLMSGNIYDETAAGGGASIEEADPRIPLTIALYRNR